ncbi:hypothetical protein [Vibrio sp. 10N.247.311.51]|uniref:hypothetical protein n=1 Tax=Vibrio sp. 10N.247.311.51 TaxID=3229996 RepID=UPI00354EF9B9
MKKVSLLAASVAFALTGCGGSDSDNGSSPTTQTITGFDGYFNQAVVFEDTNNNGVLDIDTDKIFGLTNEVGQIEISGTVTGALALQTLTPGGDVQKALALHDNKYVGKYTIDMDHKAQAMAHELVFRAPTSSSVVSPITDLVAIEAEKNGGDLEAAESAVNIALGGTDAEPVPLYDDFVEGDNADAELHKTAQILTESKAANPNSYEDKATGFAEEADKIVADIVADPTQDINDKDLKPVIIDNGQGEELVPEVVTNHLLKANEEIADDVQGIIDDLDLEVGQAFSEKFISLTDDKGNTLFTDADLKGADVEVTLVANPALEEAGIKVSLENQSLMLFSETTQVLKSGAFTIELEAFDTKSNGEKSKKPTSVIFDLEIESANELPDVNDDVEDRLQAQIDSDWSFQVGTPISNMTLLISDLFTDEEGDEIKFGTKPRLSTAYLESGIDAKYSDDFTMIILSGDPTKVAAQGTLSIDATDEFHGEGEWETVTLDLPKIEEGSIAPSPTHPLEGKFLHFIEVGSNDTNYDKAWCDSIYLNSESKMMYWNNRDNDNLATCDTDMSEFEYGVSYEVLNNQIVSIEDGMKITLDIITQDLDTDDERFLISFTDEEGDDKSTELYTYYTNEEYVEEMIHNKVNTSANNADWAERDTYIAMPPSEGSNNIVVTELDVSGIVQQFPWQDGQYTSASIHGGNTETCEILKDIYFDYGSIQVHGDNTAADNYFHWVPTFETDKEGSCYIDLDPLDPSAELPKGLYTIEAKPERVDEGERILFSFYK